MRQQMSTSTFGFLFFSTSYLYPVSSFLSAPMTEYDYSPEAYEKYLATQHRIASWVDRTLQEEPRNPFTPATPASPNVRQLDDDYNSYKPSHRSSSRHASRQHNRDRDRDRDMKDDRRPTTRHRSSSYSAPVSRPPPTRFQTVPAPRYDDKYHHSSSSSTFYPSKYTNQHSRQSSHSSSTTRLPSPTTTYPPHNTQNYSPQHISRREPIRSQTAPHGYHYPSKSAVVIPLQTGANGYTMMPAREKSFDMTVRSAPQHPLYPADAHYGYPDSLFMQTAPQIPYSAYPSPTKQQPLLKRLFLGLTGGNRSSRRKRRSSY